jgi:O-6-methylguanine DNA methyltransferase
MKRSGKGSCGRPVHWCVFETPLGPCGIAWTAEGLLRLQLPEASGAATRRRLLLGLAGAAEVERPEPWVRSLAARVRRHLAGSPQDFADVALDFTGASPLSHAVWRAAQRVAAGRTASYGELARAIGRPGAARAVGRAMARNPVALVVPCHRIVAADGSLHGFSAHGGVATKRRLLALEGWKG